jgi:hypothetical protein
MDKVIQVQVGYQIEWSSDLLAVQSYRPVTKQEVNVVQTPRLSSTLQPFHQS